MRASIGNLDVTALTKNFERKKEKNIYLLLMKPATLLLYHSIDATRIRC